MAHFSLGGKRVMPALLCEWWRLHGHDCDELWRSAPPYAVECAGCARPQRWCQGCFCVSLALAFEQLYVAFLNVRTTFKLLTDTVGDIFDLSNTVRFHTTYLSQVLGSRRALSVQRTDRNIDAILALPLTSIVEGVGHEQSPRQASQRIAELLSISKEHSPSRI